MARGRVSKAGLTAAEITVADAYRLVFASPNGQIVLRHMEARAYIGPAVASLAPISVPGQAIDPLALALVEGARRFHWETLRQIEVARVADRTGARTDG